MTEIYLVTSGEYSDYNVHYAFTERARAEEVAAWQDFDVEVLDLFGPGEDTFQRHPIIGAYLDIDEHGIGVRDIQIRDHSEVASREPEIPDPFIYNGFTHSRYRHHEGPQVAPRWTIGAKGRTEEQARKALSERLAIAVADIEAGVDPVTREPIVVPKAPAPDYTNVWPYSVQKPV
jgi:hypothetical protein